MSNHDPLCLFHAHPSFPPRFCDCERVAAIRADERGRIADAIEALPKRKDLLGALLRMDMHRNMRDLVAMCAEVARTDEATP